MLKGHGFVAWSLSDAVRAEATRRGLGHDRDTLIHIANDLRKHHGGGVFAQRIIAQIREAQALHPQQHFAIDSVRSPLEVEELRKLPDFQLWHIDAPIEIRFRRAIERGRSEGAATLAEFRAKETAEDTDDPHKQQLGNTLRMADVHLQNVGTLHELTELVRSQLPQAFH